MGEFERFLAEGRIVASTQTFKIRQFLDKGENSILIANHLKDVEQEPKRLYWDYWAITVSYYAMLYAAKALILQKGYEVKDHEAAKVALAHLCVPTPLEREDLELMDQSHRLFEEEYLASFADAQKESHIARYAAVKTYTRRRLEEVFENARTFVAKISLILEVYCTP